MNQIYVIFPYQYNGTWVFDDRDRGLAKEPFVSGIPEMIEAITEGFENRSEGFRLKFSAHAFVADANERVALIKFFEKDMGGAWYIGSYDGKHLEGWLCPALLKYFAELPEQIYIAVSGLE